jgi:hypothetical protein
MTYEEFVNKLNAVQSDQAQAALADALDGQDTVLLPSGIIRFWRETFRELRKEIRGSFQGEADYWREKANDGGIYTPDNLGDMSENECRQMATEWQKLADSINV